MHAPYATAAVPRVLASCADVYATHALVLADVPQERAIQGHPPLYCAIITQSSNPAEFA